jgi:predicted short-subunit dehydrogenase-like oxidoreductase (DUF2520 family)
MAWFLARRLTMAGYSCTSVYGRDGQVAAALATAVGAIPAEKISDIQDEIIILAVSDNALGTVSAGLSNISGDCLLVHTSGAADIGVLAAARHYGVIWPVYSIRKTDIPLHRDIPCAIEAGSTDALARIRELAHAFSDTLFEAGMQQRQWLHLAAVTGNNFINHLMTVAEQICVRQQLPFAVLYPILQQTFERIRHTSPASLQTGPAIRNDTATIGRHLELLKDDPDWQAIYKALTDSVRHTYGAGTDNP